MCIDKSYHAQSTCAEQKQSGSSSLARLTWRPINDWQTSCRSQKPKLWENFEKAWPRPVNLRTHTWITSHSVLSSFEIYTSIPCPILMHHMCCGAAGGLKVTMTSSIPLGHPTTSFFMNLKISTRRVCFLLHVGGSTAISDVKYAWKPEAIYVLRSPINAHSACAEQKQSGSSSLARLT